MATAADGLTFTSEFDSGIPNANDPDLVPLSNGAIYSALYVGSPFAASAAPRVLSFAPAFPQ